MSQVTLSSGLRLLGLQTRASLRTAGGTPWILVGGWIAIAAAQEPTLLRGYGVHLLLQATWVAAIAATGMLVSNLAPSRRTITYLASLQLLTILCAAVCVAGMAAVELVLGRSTAPVFRHVVPIAVALFPAAACLAVAASMRTTTAWIALLAALLLLMNQLPDLGGSQWSWRSIAASIAASLSVAALVHAHCRRTP